MAFEISASCMFSVHEFREFRLDFTWSDFFRKNLTPEMLNMMQSGGDVGDQPGYISLFAQPAQQFYDELTLFDVRSREDLPFSNVRDITASMGLEMRVAAALNKTGPWLDGLFCQHTQDAEWKRFAADMRTDFILPIMANSVSLGRTLRALQVRYNASLSVLDALGVGVFLVDVTGCVISHNKEAQRIIDQGDGLRMNAAKHLKLHTNDKSDQLEHMINAANGLLRGESLGNSQPLMSSSRPSGVYDYLMSVRPLSDSHSELDTDLKCAFVTVIDPTRKNVLSAKGITALGQLSVAESQTVDLLIQGFRPAAVAEQRNVSLNTVKTQLQAIAQKLRCSTQSDIIRVAAATRIPVD